MVRFRGRKVFTSFLVICLLFTIQMLHNHGPVNDASAYIGESFQKLVQFSDNENLIDPEEILQSTEESVFPVLEDEGVTKKAGKSGEIYWPTSLYRTILIYNPPPYLIWKDGNKPFRNARCEEYRCFFTRKHTLVKDMLFDAILFSPEKKLRYLPIFSNRRSNQTFIYFNLIPPMFPSSFKNWKSFFNLTMTYRNNSDISLPLGKVVPKPSAPKSDSYRDNLIRYAGRSTVNFAKGKTAIMATASGCKNPFLSEIQNFLTVDNFGDCGTKSFKLLYDTDYSEFFKNISSTYKFFLVPELFTCTSYIHLLVFEILRYDIVPVIYASDLKEILPVHSYVDATQLNPSELVALLRQIDENDVSYNEYFWWKNHYVIKSFRETTTDAFCDLCRLLHKREKRTVTDIGSWWFGQEKCRKL